MNSFDYIGEARAIRDALGNENSDWRTRIDNAIAGGSTGTEILMAVRWNLTNLLNANLELQVNLVTQIKDYIRAANKLLD